MPKRAPRTEAETDVHRAIGRRIAAARATHDLSQRDLAERLGYTQTWLHAVETGKIAISAADLGRVGRMLDYPCGYFLEPDFTPASAPRNRPEWEAMYRHDPELAAAHASIDVAFRALKEAHADKAP